MLHTQRCVHCVCGLTLYSCSFRYGRYAVRIFRNVPIKQPLCKSRGAHTTLLISSDLVELSSSFGEGYLCTFSPFMLCPRPF